MVSFHEISFNFEISVVQRGCDFSALPLCSEFLNGTRIARNSLRAQSGKISSYYQKLWIDDVMKKAAYPSA